MIKNKTLAIIMYMMLDLCNGNGKKTHKGFDLVAEKLNKLN